MKQFIQLKDFKKSKESLAKIRLYLLLKKKKSKKKETIDYSVTTGGQAFHFTSHLTLEQQSSQQK